MGSNPTSVKLFCTYLLICRVFESDYHRFIDFVPEVKVLYREYCKLQFVTDSIFAEQLSLTECKFLVDIGIVGSGINFKIDFKLAVRDIMNFNFVKVVTLKVKHRVFIVEAINVEIALARYEESRLYWEVDNFIKIE